MTSIPLRLTLHHEEDPDGSLLLPFATSLGSKVAANKKLDFVQAFVRP